MSSSAMRAPLKGGVSRKSFLVVVVLFVLLVTVTGDKHGNGTDHRHHSMRPSSLPRKLNPFRASTTHVPPSPRNQNRAGEDGDPKTLYEDDKRIIHTGPNPLHN